MFYKMDLSIAPYEAEPLEIVSQGKGNTSLISAYNSSSVGLTERWTLNAGIYGQLLTLNNKWSVEPRVGLKWQATPKATFALAYGMYSRMEKMDVYFVKRKVQAINPSIKILILQKHSTLCYHSVTRFLIA